MATHGQSPGETRNRRAGDRYSKTGKYPLSFRLSKIDFLQRNAMLISRLFRDLKGN